MKNLFIRVFPVILSFYSSLGFSQLLTVRNTNLSLINTSNIYINGDTKMDSGSSINNDGTIYIKGDWINNSIDNFFGSSIGLLILNGNNQLIGGQSSTTFPELLFQGNGVKKLNQDIAVGNSNTGSINLAKCILDLNNKTVTLNNSSTTALIDSGGSIISESYDFTSKVIWKIQNGSGVYTIPFATVSSVKIPVTLQNTTNDIGTVSFSTYATGSNNLPLPIQPIEVSHIRNGNGNDNSSYTADRFWLIDKTGTDDLENITFKIASTELPLSGNGILTAQLWNPAIDGWNPALPAQLNPDAFTVSIPSVSTTGVWALAASSSPLPVELLFFDAKPTLSNSVLINWITASEKQNDYFTIERSANGIQFEPLHIVKGAGTTSVQQNYQWEDVHPLSGISYYRLKQTDFNGDYSYSVVKAVQFDGSDLDLILFPNPAKDRIYFTVYTTNEDKYSLAIYDVAGKAVRNYQLNSINENQYSITIERNELRTGIYLYHLLQDNKIIKSGKLIFDY